MLVQRYRVSIWIYSSRRYEEPFFMRKEVMSASDAGAVQSVMRLCGVRLVHRARVVALRSNACQWLENISLSF